MRKLFTIRNMTAALLILVLAAIGFAFANVNTVGTSYAGDGTNTISGYNITNIRYDLDETDTVNFPILSVAFDIDQAYDELYVAIDDGAGTTWVSSGCAPASSAAATNVTCSFAAGPPAIDAINLRVVAAY